ncbi:MAG: L,D-transpeptidase [Eubacteriales bacterium]|nr:L,D-transpeptidase [Eubacteriales bacterium]
MKNHRIHAKHTFLSGKAGRVKSTWIIAGAVALCVIAGVGIAAKTSLENVKVYPSGTTINGISVEGKTPAQAKDILTKEWNKKSITVKNESGKQSVKITKPGFEYAIDDPLKTALYPGYFKAIGLKLNKSSRQQTIAMTPAAATKRFRKQMLKLSCLTDSSRKKTRDAYIDMKTTDFKIVKEVYGNNIDREKLYEAVMKAFAEGKTTYSFKEKDFYKQPELTSESDAIKKQLEYCEKYMKIKISYKAPLTSYTIKPSELNKMISVSSSGEISVNDAAVKDFVANRLTNMISSVGITRKLKSRGGSTYTVSGGNYGYTVNVKKEVKALTEDLKKGEDVERMPEVDCFVKDLKSDDKSDIGDTFVEISISRQTMWVVKNGRTVVTTPVVTGNVSDGHATPMGVCMVAYKQSGGVTLSGKNADGSDYESKVSYWIPFNGGVGIHDAPWRGAFGGGIYYSAGSHGCVNTPPVNMPRVYANVTAGEPVIVHG